jgi:hypothetical protein
VAVSTHCLSFGSRYIKHRKDLEFCEECVWVEIPTLDGFNLLIGNHYFSPDCKPENTARYFRFLEGNLDAHNFRVIIVGDFNAPGFDWKRELSLPNSHYYCKFKGEAIYSSTCLLNLNQCNVTDHTSNLLDLIFSNLSDLDITPVDPGIIKPDNYHPLLVINVSLPLSNCSQSVVSSYRKFSSGNYALLYHILSTTDWSCAYGTSSVDTAVTCLNAGVQDALECAISRGVINTHLKFPHWYSTSQRTYIKKKNYYCRRLKKIKQTLSTINPLTVKAAIQSDRLN